MKKRFKYITEYIEKAGFNIIKFVEIYSKILIASLIILIPVGFAFDLFLLAFWPVLCTLGFVIILFLDLFKDEFGE